MHRPGALPEFVQKTHKKWIVLDEGVAFVVQGDQWRIVKSKPQGNAYLYAMKRGEVISEILEVAPLQKLSKLG